jgi:hypothetical protein
MGTALAVCSTLASSENFMVLHTAATELLIHTRARMAAYTGSATRILAKMSAKGRGGGGGEPRGSMETGRRVEGGGATGVQ